MKEFYKSFEQVGVTEQQKKLGASLLEEVEKSVPKEDHTATTKYVEQPKKKGFFAKLFGAKKQVIEQPKKKKEFQTIFKTY